MQNSADTQGNMNVQSNTGTQQDSMNTQNKTDFQSSTGSYGNLGMMPKQQKPNKKKKGCLTAVVAFAALLIVVGIAGSVTGRKSSKTDSAASDTPAASSTAAKSEKAEPVLESIEVSYAGSTKEGTMIDAGNTGILVTAKYSDGTEKTVDSGWTVDNAAALEAEQTQDFTVSYNGKSSSLQITCTTLTPDTFKAQCQDISYEDLSRNPDSYTGQLIKFTGKIIQVQESGTDAVYRINVTEDQYGLWDDTIYVAYSTAGTSSRLLEDDIVTLYGTYCGLYTYTSIFGASVTIPSVAAQYIDLN